MSRAPALRALPTAPPPGRGWQGEVEAFKRRLLETTLAHASGNRTRAAHHLRLQRTYLLRLIRQLGVTVPAPRRGRARPAA